MGDEPSQEFHVCASLRRKSQAEKVVEKEGCFGLSLTVRLSQCSYFVLWWLYVTHDCSSEEGKKEEDKGCDRFLSLCKLMAVA